MNVPPFSKRTGKSRRRSPSIMSLQNKFVSKERIDAIVAEQSAMYPNASRRFLRRLNEVIINGTEISEAKVNMFKENLLLSLCSSQEFCGKYRIYNRVFKRTSMPN